MTTQIDNLNNIENKKLLKMLGKIAVPIALQSLIASSLNLVDNIMVGSLGELELNAVGISVQIFFVYWMLIFGFCGGAATFVAQFFGVKDFRNIRGTTGFSVLIGEGVAVVFFLGAMIFPEQLLRLFTRFPEVIEVGVPYVRIASVSFLLVGIMEPLAIALRATQQTRIPLYASVVALAANTCMNYILIFGKLGFPMLGVKGAAIATVISRFIEVSILIYFIFIRKNVLGGALKEFFGFDKILSMKVVKNALPTTANETLWALGASMYMAAFARIGVTEGAVVQACNTVSNIFSMLAFSIGDAILILVGEKLGQGKKELAYNMTKKLLTIAVIVGIVMGALTIVFGDAILQLFDFSEEGQALARKTLIVYGAMLFISVFDGANVSGTLRSGGDTKFAMWTELLIMWGIGVPLAFLSSLVWMWPIYFAVLITKSEEIVKGVVLLLRVRSKKWLNNVVEDIELGERGKIPDKEG